ncbi:sulfatase-like hydrolase/transferase [Puniceicoccus vermicola]|uniref:Sulfatase-like hydrolase/transferase n=1 Tax=Puniceicoccus vermicola TaxID=388746 RepID=A0A7X1B0E5_9BACT|nr:sulfatase-like hydrolase/transferase [Puniceicoccus vermicola]MBC2603252.1 sulfatase-like hydrolase/transferase [Puniceicoccus vermicola]
MKRHPNVIVCLSDQWRAFEAGCYGNQAIQTPHLDRLAEEGIRFETAVSNFPVCTPARSEVISGQHYRTCSPISCNTNELWPEKSRTWFPQPTIAERFREANYETALIGKWHMGPEPLLCGFDSAIYPCIVHRHYDQEYVENGGEPFRVGEFGPNYEKRRLSDFLGQTRENPFFLYYNISQPHMPLGEGNLPNQFRGLYEKDQLPLRPNVFRDGVMADCDEWFWTYLDPDFWYRTMVLGEKPRETDHPPEGYNLRDLYRDYYEMVTCADEQLGHLMDELRRLGLAEDTILVFSSDHGDNLGSHHLFNKGQLIEESIRVPLVYWAPDRYAPRVERKRLGQLIDIMPTMLDLAGIGVPEGLHGRSIRSVLEGSESEGEQNLAFIETPGGEIGVRSSIHMLGAKIDPESNSILEDEMIFYDLEQDPFEENNIAGNLDSLPLQNALFQRLQSWHAKTPRFASTGVGNE